MRRMLTLGVPIAAATLLAGCSLPGIRACTEIGYSNAVTVRVADAAASRVGELRVCATEECAAETASPAQRVDDGEWTVNVFMAAPDSVTVVALDRAGSVITSTKLSVDWLGTDEPNGPGCDNASIAAPVTLEIPSD